ncbi:MAG: LemA family protein [Ignavibacteriaceae bacterium]|jgi:LemA protein|nr:MAG: LemA family protein [Chlorobiota bacterium]KXK02534.1 MAG: LemA family protein [Chlorobi bacterium OLB4]MBV6398127.1 Protein LemA [Ignavibacteria bacterium]MCC6886576.1 LemA family protein [Ignavibacteriales bacterium]MCE7952349.1 LemA family protein [Chlorobi bacterium CHB7]MDL1886466.1 LemA family protein [Ignavibacteria bacterium CHB1]MEB2329816.1 LemA family protein [Ignavibacteriaceae bacterium]OQY77433.1 MAG: LemA family protein [Ignavibacteriales bacterium UTCHB1]RIK48061.1 M
MKTTFQKLIFLAITVSLSLNLTGCGYNSLVSQEENVNSAWAQVENQYQRRADLIPNLVNTVKGSADFEKSVLTEVTDARSKVGQTKITADDLNDPEKFQQFQNAQDQLSSAISRLLMVVENYPQIKSNENFLQLQAQLEGTENRISVERKRFNEAVQTYNTSIRKFPTIITAKIFGFQEKQYFQSREGSEEAPDVKFDFKKEEKK